jgi:hypothetical protein
VRHQKANHVILIRTDALSGTLRSSGTVLVTSTHTLRDLASGKDLHDVIIWNSSGSCPGFQPLTLLIEMIKLFIWTSHGYRDAC